MVVYVLYARVMNEAPRNEERSSTRRTGYVYALAFLAKTATFVFSYALKSFLARNSLWLCWRLD